MYADAKYGKDLSGNVNCILVKINGESSAVPMDSANTDYQNIMQLVAEGKLVIAPADA